MLAILLSYWLCNIPPAKRPTNRCAWSSDQQYTVRFHREDHFFSTNVSQWNCSLHCEFHGTRAASVEWCQLQTPSQQPKWKAKMFGNMSPGERRPHFHLFYENLKFMCSEICLPLILRVWCSRCSSMIWPCRQAVHANEHNMSYVITWSSECPKDPKGISSFRLPVSHFQAIKSIITSASLALIYGIASHCSSPSHSCRHLSHLLDAIGTLENQRHRPWDGARFTCVCHYFVADFWILETLRCNTLHQTWKFTKIIKNHLSSIVVPLKPTDKFTCKAVKHRHCTSLQTSTVQELESTSTLPVLAPFHVFSISIYQIKSSVQGYSGRMREEKKNNFFNCTLRNHEIAPWTKSLTCSGSLDHSTAALAALLPPRKGEDWEGRIPSAKIYSSLGCTTSRH